MTDLARPAGLSRAHFSRLYFEKTRRTPASFLADLRFAEAKRLLMDMNTPIGSVAKGSGLRKDQAMLRLFKARTGLTPRQWRVANRAWPATRDTEEQGGGRSAAAMEHDGHGA